MTHRIVSVYFPDDTVLDDIKIRLINNVSISSFIVEATIKQLAQLKGVSSVEKDDHE